MNKIHRLKIHPEYFRSVKKGFKTSEIRLDDGRDFLIGDRLVLEEFRPRKGYTGKFVERKVTDITWLCSIIPGSFDHRWCVLHMTEASS